MPPKKERGPGPLVNGAEAETLFHDVTENEGKSEHRVPDPFHQLGVLVARVLLRIPPEREQ